MSFIFQLPDNHQLDYSGDRATAVAEEIEDKLRFYVNSEEAEISSH